MLGRLCCATLCALGIAHVAQAQSDFLSLEIISLPNYVGFGLGGVNEYMGADAFIAGVVPFARLKLDGEKFISLQGNYATWNVIDHPNWRAGPAGSLRFGRSDVRDEVVDDLGDINPTVELGGFVTYQTLASDDPRDRWQFNASYNQDVLDVHGGSLSTVSVRRFFGMGRFAVGGIALGATYGSDDYTDTFFSVPNGSELPVFEASGGARDIRAQLLLVQPLSLQWSVGGGIQVQQLLGDAADSPIVQDRGNATQVLFGLGAARTW